LITPNRKIDLSKFGEKFWQTYFASLLVVQITQGVNAQ